MTRQEILPMRRTPALHIMETQMFKYEQDGVIRGHALGRHEISYGKYTVKIYSESPGKVFYTFSYDDKVKQELPVVIPEKQEEKEKRKIEWGRVGEVVGAILTIGVATAGMALGAYHCLSTGDSSVFLQNFNNFVGAVSQH
jgi:hypothetical protein